MLGKNLYPSLISSDQPYNLITACSYTLDVLNRLPQNCETSRNNSSIWHSIKIIEGFQIRSHSRDYHVLRFDNSTGWDGVDMEIDLIVLSNLWNYR